MDSQSPLHPLQWTSLLKHKRWIDSSLRKAINIQDQIRVTDLKDRSVAEHNFERVNFMSIFYLIVLVTSGLIQVILLRSLFDDKSMVNTLWSKMLKN